MPKRGSLQLNFFCMPDESINILKNIMNSGCMLYCNLSSDKNLSLFTVGQNVHRSCYICPEGLNDQIIFNRINDNMYSIDFFVSPVIEYSPPVLRINKLSRGRIYVNTGYDGRDGWVEKPDVLKKTYKHIESYLKKSVLTNNKLYGGYISKEAELFQKNNNELVQF